MKISLITPPRLAISPRDAVRVEMGVPHPGILCIAEFLLSHDIETTILDLNILPNRGSDREIIDYQQVHTMINRLWFNYCLREDNRANVLRHPNEATRQFGRIYYDNLDTLRDG